ncbi:MAG: hypothetical protein IPM52_13210 [Bacteroidetes bacterium]|nr:hypothetical protein [Bacteroidota bacterium]
MQWNITIGNYRLAMLESVEIVRSVEQLSDTAIIVLPATFFNKTLNIEQQIKPGDAVKIQLGYDNYIRTEFEGYLERIATNDGSLSLHCEDALYIFRYPLQNREFINPSLDQLLNYLLPGGFQLANDYDFRYDRYVVRNQTAWQMLKQLQEETRANIYIKGKTLHVHPPYSELFGEAVYSFQHNIEKSELEFRNADDRKVQVVVEGKSHDGKVLRATAGQSGGDVVQIKIEGVSHMPSLQKLADEQLKVKSYTGYSGSFTAWLLPFCDAGFAVSLYDNDYQHKSGTYYATEVITRMSKEGASRTIILGRKL